MHHAQFLFMRGALLFVSASGASDGAEAEDEQDAGRRVPRRFSTLGQEGRAGAAAAVDHTIHTRMPAACRVQRARSERNRRGCWRGVL